MTDTSIKIPSHFCVLVCFLPPATADGKKPPFAFLGIDNNPRREFDTAAAFASRDEADLRRAGLSDGLRYVILEVGDVAALDDFVANTAHLPFIKT